MKLPEELLAQLYTLENALTKCFGGYKEQDDGYFKATCCGKALSYGSGVMGPDIAYCKECGRKVILALSPHVSPLLIAKSVTHIPSEELIDAMGKRCWMVIIPEEEA